MTTVVNLIIPKPSRTINGLTFEGDRPITVRVPGTPHGLSLFTFLDAVFKEDAVDLQNRMFTAQVTNVEPSAIRVRWTGNSTPPSAMSDDMICQLLADRIRRALDRARQNTASTRIASAVGRLAIGTAAENP